MSVPLGRSITNWLLPISISESKSYARIITGFFLGSRRLSIRPSGRTRISASPFGNPAPDPCISSSRSSGKRLAMSKTACRRSSRRQNGITTTTTPRRARRIGDSNSSEWSLSRRMTCGARTSYWRFTRNSTTGCSGLASTGARISARRKGTPFLFSRSNSKVKSNRLRAGQRLTPCNPKNPISSACNPRSDGDGVDGSCARLHHTMQLTS